VAGSQQPRISVENKSFHDIASNYPYEGKRKRPGHSASRECKSVRFARVCDSFERIWVVAMSFKTRLTCCAFSFCAPIFGSAFAAEINLPDSSQWTALETCAAYGAGFASAESTATCVRIGGHVRVEWTRTYVQTGSRTVRTDNFGTSDLAEPRHLRVGADDPYGYDPFVQPASSQSKTAQ
jgi:hypothetical protein